MKTSGIRVGINIVTSAAFNHRLYNAPVLHRLHHDNEPLFPISDSVRDDRALHQIVIGFDYFIAEPDSENGALLQSVLKGKSRCVALTNSVKPPALPKKTPGD